MNGNENKVVFDFVVITIILFEITLKVFDINWTWEEKRWSGVGFYKLLKQLYANNAFSNFKKAIINSESHKKIPLFFIK